MTRAERLLWASLVCRHSTQAEGKLKPNKVIQWRQLMSALKAFQCNNSSELAFQGSKRGIRSQGTVNNDGFLQRETADHQNE